MAARLSYLRQALYTIELWALELIPPSCCNGHDGVHGLVILSQKIREVSKEVLVTTCLVLVGSSEKVTKKAIHLSQAEYDTAKPSPHAACEEKLSTRNLGHLNLVIEK